MIEAVKKSYLSKDIYHAKAHESSSYVRRAYNKRNKNKLKSINIAETQFALFDRGDRAPL